MVGVVVAVADGVEEVGAGDRVTVEPTLVCGHCKPCRHGAENLCENLEFFGCGYREGGMADVFSVPARRLHKVPAGFQRLPGRAHRAPGHAGARRAPGRGPEGQDGGRPRLGHHRAPSPDGRPTRRGGKDREHRHLGRQAGPGRGTGADAAVDARAPDLAEAVRGELGESVDVVFDCVSHQDTLDRGGQDGHQGRHSGRSGRGAVPVTVDLPVIQEYQIRLQGAATYRWEDFDDAVAIIGNGTFDAARFITATFPSPKPPRLSLPSAPAKRSRSSW